MDPDKLLRRHRAALPGWMPLYYERPMELVRGEGVKVWDSEGNEYLDFFGGIVTTISGHAIPEITEVIRSQADRIVHSSTLYLIENQVRLAEKLIELAPISGDKKVFFTVSGTEANEAALLFATRYRGSGEVVALRSSYHGRSFAIQGVGGFIEAPPGYFERIKEILDGTGALLIVDEVQTAFGRTGSHFWGIEAFDVEPDLITMAKGLGNGLAIGAVMGRTEVMESVSPNLHLSTFGGNHMSTAGALANLEYILNNDLQRNAAEVGGYLKDRLLKMASEHPIVGEVRGRGLMLGMEFVGLGKEPDPEAAARFLEACRARGVLVGKGGLKANTIRVSPPLIVTHEAAKEAADAFEETMAEIGMKEKA
jgi:4-aminobutyrate aminotransferase-like enzyme